MPLIRRSLELGRQGCILEAETRWEGRRPRLCTRRAALAVEAVFQGPAEALEPAWADIVASALAAGGLVSLEALAADPRGSLPAFDAAFRTCLASTWPQAAPHLAVGLALRVRAEEEWQAP